MAMNFDFSEKVLRRMVEARASDVHLTPGFPPAIRDKGKIAPMEGFPVLSGQDTREVVFGILNDDQRKRFENAKQLDFAYEMAGVARFRVNLFIQRARAPSCASSRSSSPRSTSSGCRRSCASSAPNRAAWCWSPARPAPASRPRWPRWST